MPANGREGSLNGPPRNSNSRQRLPKADTLDVVQIHQNLSELGNHQFAIERAPEYTLAILDVFRTSRAHGLALAREKSLRNWRDARNWHFARQIVFRGYAAAAL